MGEVIDKNGILFEKREAERIETKKRKEFERKRQEEAEELKQKGKKLEEELLYAEFYNQDLQNMEEIERLYAEIEQNELDQQDIQAEEWYAKELQKHKNQKIEDARLLA